MPLSIMLNQRTEETSPLPPFLSLANLLEEGDFRPCFMRKKTTNKGVFLIAPIFTKQLLPHCLHWSRLLATEFLRGIGIRDKMLVAWGDLPSELCMEIGIHLASRLDILHFRSVCKKWRSSLPVPTRFLFQVPSPPNTDPEFCNLSHFITEVSIAKGVLLRMAFEEVDQGSKFRGYMAYPSTHKFEYPEISFMASPEHPLSQIALISKAYHLRLAFTRSDSHPKRDKGQWDLRYNPFVKKPVIVSSNAEDGVNPTYPRTSDLSVVSLLCGGEGVMHGRLAMLRLGVCPENLEWDTDFCSQVFEDSCIYRGRLCS